MSSVTGSVQRDRDSESLTLSERGGKWEGDQEREREKGRLNEGHGGPSTSFQVIAYEAAALLSHLVTRCGEETLRRG